MIKCDPPQPRNTNENEYKVIWRNIPFSFEWPYIPPWDNKPNKLVLSGPLTPDMDSWELKQIDNIWYWVKE